MKEKVQTIKKHNSKGITLVALVVTIVVLLILAGITITVLFSDNGVIKTAQDAAEKNKMAEARTKVDLVMADWQVVKRTENKTFENHLKEAFGEANVTANAEAEGFDVKVDGYTFTVKDDGTVTTVGGGTDVTPGGDDDNPPVTSTKVADNLDKVISNTENTDLTDANNNKITIPAGFKIVPHGTNNVEYNYLGDENHTPAVQDGIVIKNEADGNEFVWVPVGTINNKSDDSRGATTPITLGRYTFANDGVENLEQEATVDCHNTPKKIGSYYFEVSESFEGGSIEGTTYKAASGYGNTKAVDLQEWIKTTKANGGYYIARYEASKNETDNTKAASVAGKAVWTSITQPNAATAARKMYPTPANTKEGYTYYSDLLNSYAGDTAIVFIQKYGTETDASSYSKKNKSTSFTTTGANPDKYRNIHDMSGNATEWSTETSTYWSGYAYPCTDRGGSCDTHSGGLPSRITSFRHYCKTDYSYSDVSFRLTLYVK